MRPQQSHRCIHGVWAEAACHDLVDAGQKAAGADCHEGDVQIGRIDILSRGQILMAACYLHSSSVVVLVLRHREFIQTSAWAWLTDNIE